MILSIPDWTERGIIPPIDGRNPTSIERSPYIVTLVDVILKYGTSKKRNEILTGFLNFRSELHNMGVTKGFQWLDGSFFEDTENNEQRSPNDIDVVNFFYMPDDISQEEFISRNPAFLFNIDGNKKLFKVDGYFVELSTATPEVIVKSSSYWYSLWSHRRDQTWKGFLQIDLSPFHDETARANLTNIKLVKEDTHE